MKKLSFGVRFGVAASTVALACAAWNFLPHASAQDVGTPKMSPAAQSRFALQLKALDNFRSSLSASQRKVPSALLLAKSVSNTRTTRAALPAFGTSRGLHSLQGSQSVLIYGQMTARIKAAIEREGTLTGFFPEHGVASAQLSTEAMEHIASATEISSISFNPGPTTFRSEGSRRVRGFAATSGSGPVTNAGTGAVVSEGDKTHEADKARAEFKVSGAGVKVGVISDSSEQLSRLVKLQELPADTQVLAGQAGTGESEGTAMMEIIHDLAPDAKLEFSTAGDSPEQMAKNILALQKDGCKIIVDDIGFFTEPVYQEGVVSAAIRQVSSQGVVYLSAMGNLGNPNIGPTSVWDGYFVDGGAITVGTNKDLIANDWNSQKDVFNLIAAGNGDSGAVLSWAEPMGKATNDYNLYVVDSDGNIVNFSADVQDGKGNPQEFVDTGIAKGTSIVVTRPTNSKALAMRFSMLNYGLQLEHYVGPTGFGHNLAEFALSVAAAPAQDPGPYPNAFNSTSPIEPFSSIGPRKLFFAPDGSASERVIQKPDITAADDVSCKTSDLFDPFYGTSAAAPHAAAIAALAWSASPKASADQIKTRMINGTIDIQAKGYDNEAGYGIVMAPLVLRYTDPTPTPGPTATATPRPTATATPGPSPTPTTTTPLPAGSIALTEPTYSVVENAGNARISVRRVVNDGQGDFGAVSVKYQTYLGGTATDGLDYRAVTGTLSWTDGDSTTKTFLVPIIDDKAREGNETVFLRIYDLKGSGTIADSRKSAILTIVDNETGTVDNIKPIVAITNPSSSSTAGVSNVDSIEGTVSDEGGSGVKSVVLYIQRPSDGLYWNGSEFGTPKVALPTTLRGKTWSRTSGNPPRASLKTDFLVITALATDGAGNTAQTSARVFVDSEPPAVYILSPLSGARLRALVRANGTVSDAGGDSTLVLYLRRGSDRKYWTGSGTNFTTTPTPLPVQLAASGEWMRTGWAAFAPGSYTLIATGTDEVGNSASATSEFTITSATSSGGGS